MWVDVSKVAGFPLEFDPDLMDVRTAPDRLFTKKYRQAGEQLGVLLQPEAVDPDQDVYNLFYPERFPPAEQAALDGLELTYSLVLLPPLKVGREFVKTTGHYHTDIPGTSLPFPEVYTQLYGKLNLLLQKRDPANSEALLDCQLVEMTPGFSITIPPGYAHILINTSGEPGLMAGLYGRSFKPDYQPIIEKRGLAYYLVEQDGHLAIERNPHYAEAPSLGHLGDLAGTVFEYPDPGEPVWSSFISDPARYAFLTQQAQVQKRFG